MARKDDQNPAARTGFRSRAAPQKMQQEEVHLLLELSGGPRFGNNSVRFWTSDLTQDYVRLNSDYTT